MIASVAFRNFKALRATSLKLTPFNLVIGPNGSGKTSLIQALQTLRSLAKLPLGDGGAPTRLSGPEIVFQFAAPYAGVSARLACVSDLVCDLLRVESPSPAEWAAVKAKLTTMRSYFFDHKAMAAPAARSADAELAGDGGNLAAVLAARRQRAPAAFARVEAELIRLLPEFTAILCRDEPGGRVGFALGIGPEEPPVSAENLSQGVLYVLGMLVLSLDPAPPAVVCIEEIDRGIHPRMLREVRDALYRLSYPASLGETREPVQVIATTHSPYLLDLFRDHPEEIVIMQKHGHAARFERLADRADLAELLREGSLGDMWFSGILGGVPEEA
ncbi:MAG: AAA family ATPase [Undibacterium sp.]|nr:AAA family ATPase [Opitutaceae bacterium]